jgi:hypothetical protein
MERQNPLTSRGASAIAMAVEGQLPPCVGRFGFDCLAPIQTVRGSVCPVTGIDPSSRSNFGQRRTRTIPLLLAGRLFVSPSKL